MSAHVGPRTLQFFHILFLFKGFKISLEGFTVMFWFLSITIEKFTGFGLGKWNTTQCVPGSVDGSVLATNPHGNVLMDFGNWSDGNTPQNLFTVLGLCSNARSIC